MENNFVKSTVNTYERLLCEHLEQAIDSEFTLPDFCPDAVRVLKCRAVPRICLKSVNGKTLTVDGNVSITVFYADEDGDIFSYEYSYPFSKTKDVGQNIEEDRLTVKAKCEYMNCRAVSNRKLDIHGAIRITAIVNRKKTVEVISDIDDRNIETLKGISPATTPSDYAEKSIVIEEDCELPGGETGKSILRYEGTAFIKECKILSGKVILKGDMSLSVRYLQENNIGTMKSVIPFSQVLDIKTPGDNCECSGDAGICSLELTPKTDDDGNFNIFSVNCKILICAETYCKNDIPVILDAYSRKYEAQVVKTPIKLSKLTDNISDNFTVKDDVKTSDFSILSVIDNWYDVRINDSKVENGEIDISGSLTVSFILKDTDNNVSYLEKKTDFNRKIPIENTDGNLTVNPDIFVNSFSFTLADENRIEVRAELTVKTPLYDNIDICAVTDIEISEKIVDRGNRDTAMVVYFGENGEKLWDIARKYFSGVDDIKKINQIQDETLTESRMILIPVGY